MSLLAAGFLLAASLIFAAVEPWPEFLDSQPFVAEPTDPELRALRMDPADALDAELRAVRWDQP